MTQLINREILESVLSVLRDIAAGSFNTRIEQRSSDVNIDALIMGINTLAEELEDKASDQERMNEAMLNILEDVDESKKQLECALEITERTSFENEMFLEAARGILECEEFSEAARKIFDACCRLTGAQSGYVALLSEDGMENEVLFLESGGMPCSVDPSLPMPIRGLRGEAYSFGKAVYNNDFMNSEWVKFMPEGHVYLQNVMFAPLKIEGKTVGIMGLANKQGDFTDDDARIGEAFGELASVALMNTRNKEALKGNVSFMKVLLDTIPSPLYYKDTDHVYQGCNNAFCEFLGKSKDEIVGSSVFDIAPRHLAEKYRKADNRLFEDPGVQQYENRVKYSDGTEHDVFFTKATYTGNDGNVAGLVGVMVDITEQKEKSRELERARTRIENLLESIRDGFFSLDPDFKVTYFNDAAEKLLGKKREAVIGRKLFDAFHEAKGSVFEEKYSKALAEKKAVSFETYFGVEPYVNWYDVRVYPYEGGISVFFNIITERKEAEKIIRENEERFRLLFNTGNDVVLVHQVDENHVPGAIVEVNDVACNILGYTKEEFCSMSPLQLRDPLDPSSPGKTSEHLKKSGTAVFERLLRSRDGRSIPFEINFSEFEYQGEKLGLAVCRDISERKQAEKALRESEENYRMLFENANDLIQSVAMDGTIQYVNRKWCETLGYKEEEVVGLSIFDILKEDSRDHCVRMFRDLKDGKPIGTVETVYLARDGREILVEGSSSLRMKDGRVSGTVGIFRDITEKKKIEEELQKAQKLESIGILAGGIAHDFNNLLMGITGNVSLARMYAEGNKDFAEILDSIAEAGKRAEKLTNQLLTFSKGGTPVRKYSTVSGFLKESAEFHLSGSNVSCTYDFDENLWSVEIDRDQIRQVLHSLIQNSRDAMPEGGTITISAENAVLGLDSGVPLESGDYVCISVRDEGTGIPKEILSRIFDPFFSTKKMGAGMGLSTAFSILKQHDGYIEAAGDTEKGAEFRIYLPAHKLKIDKTNTYRMKKRAGKGKILLMDDEEVVRFVTGKMLEELGYEVESAEEGDTALNKYREARENENPFDAVIMDLTIPGGMGGKEAIQKLMEYDPDAKAIVSSGYSNDPVVSAFEDYGFKASVPKPYEIEELGKALEKVISI